MLRGLSSLIIALVLVSAVAGCAVRRSGCDSPEGTGLAVPTLVPLSEPPAANLDDSGRMALIAAEGALAGSPLPRGRLALSPHDCQCTAAANAPLANALEAEGEMAEVCTLRKCGREAEARALLAQIERIRACDERNRAAAAALELYYRLAEAEGNRALVEKGLAEVEQALGEYRRVQDTGLPTAGALGTLERQQIELRTQQVQAETAIRQLNGQLRVLLALRLEPDELLWPDVDLRVGPAGPGEDQAVSEGLVNRADLAALRLIHNNLEPDKLTIIRGALRQSDSMLGAFAPATRALRGLVIQRRLCCEIGERQEQIAELLAAQYRVAEEEIRQAVRATEERIRLAWLAEEKRMNWEAEYDRLRQRRQAKGDATDAEVRQARLESLRAQGDALHTLVELKIAEVKLKQAQGRLADECGWPLPPMCDCCVCDE